MGAGAILIEPTFDLGAAFWPIMSRIVIPGAVASTIGAFFTFGIAYYGGKPMIDRYARFLGFGWSEVLAVEQKLLGRVSLMIFLLRALPIVPLSLISAAAGVLRFPVWQFTIWTLLGSLPRCLILGYLGFLTRDTYEGLAGNLNKVETVISAIIVLAAFGVIMWLRSRMKPKI